MDEFMTPVAIDKETRLEILRAELTKLYRRYDETVNPIGKQTYRGFIVRIKNRIDELKEREKYLKG